MAGFPIVTTAEQARCFECGELTTGDTIDSGNAPGHGQFRRFCAICKLWTWFDIRRGER